MEEHYNAVLASQQELNHSLEIISKKIAYYKELEEKEITNEEDSYQLSTYISMVQAGKIDHSIHIPLKAETAAQELIDQFDPAILSRMLELLQTKTGTNL